MKPRYRYDRGIEVWMLVHCPPWMKCRDFLLRQYRRYR